MMESVGFKKGLIRYASENGIAHHEKLHYTRRMKMYTGLLAVLLILLTTLLLSQKDVKATVMRTPGLLYQEKGQDSVSNLYNIKVVNKTMNDIPLTVKLEDGDGNVQVVGKNINVQKEGQGSGSFFITIPKKRIQQRKTVLNVGLYQGDKRIVVVKTSFLGPLYSNN
jgi:polyferredoxin